MHIVRRYTPGYPLPGALTPDRTRQVLPCLSGCNIPEGECPASLGGGVFSVTLSNPYPVPPVLRTPSKLTLVHVDTFEVFAPHSYDFRQFAFCLDYRETESSPVAWVEPERG